MAGWKETSHSCHSGLVLGWGKEPKPDQNMAPGRPGGRPLLGGVTIKPALWVPFRQVQTSRGRWLSRTQNRQDHFFLLQSGSVPKVPKTLFPCDPFHPGVLMINPQHQRNLPRILSFPQYLHRQHKHLPPPKTFSNFTHKNGTAVVVIGI